MFPLFPEHDNEKPFKYVLTWNKYKLLMPSLKSSQGRNAEIFLEKLPISSAVKSAGF